MPYKNNMKAYQLIRKVRPILVCMSIFIMAACLIPSKKALAEVIDGKVEINETNFPDAAFREYISSE